MTHRLIGLLIALIILITPRATAAQQAGKPYRIGYLFTGVLPASSKRIVAGAV